MPKFIYISIMFLTLIFHPLVAMAVMSSANYQINYEEITSGGGISNSDSYQELDSVGEIGSGLSASDEYKVGAGLNESIQSDLMRVPTLENNNAYNSLDFTINRGDDNPEDAEYAIMIIENGSIEFYIQADDSIGSEMAWQTYTNWGGAGGGVVTGLRAETEYAIKIKARQGDFTETAWSASTSATTSGLTLTFDISKDGVSLGSLTPNIVSSDSYFLTVITNAEFGYLVTISEDGDLRNGLNVIDDVSDGVVDRGSEYGIGLTGADKSFSDDQAITNDMAVMSNPGRLPDVTSNVVVVTHKAVISQSMEAGEYRHKVSYVATSTF